MATLRLYGFPLSNYYNIIKAALLEAGVEFEDVRTMPSQKDGYLTMSPMGKVPVLEVDGTALTETSAMVDYVAEHLGGSLYPEQALARAQVRELMKYVEVYIDLAARPCFGEAFFGGTVSDEVKATAQANLKKGVAALNRRARFTPYIAGSAVSYADFAAYFSVPLAEGVAQKLFGWSLVADIPGFAGMVEKMRERDSIKAIEASRGG